MSKLIVLTFPRMKYTDHRPPYRGEPLNIIISAFSDPYILTDEGFLEYSKSVSILSDQTTSGLTFGDRQVDRLLRRVLGYSPWQ